MRLKYYRERQAGKMLLPVFFELCMEIINLNCTRYAVPKHSLSIEIKGNETEEKLDRRIEEEEKNRKMKPERALKSVDCLDCR